MDDKQSTKNTLNMNIKPQCDPQPLTLGEDSNFHEIMEHMQPFCYQRATSYSNSA